MQYSTERSAVFRTLRLRAGEVFAALSLGAMVAMFFFKARMMLVLAVCAAAGILLYLGGLI